MNSGTEQEADYPVDLLSNLGKKRCQSKLKVTPMIMYHCCAIGSRLSCCGQVLGSQYTSKDGTKWYRNCPHPNALLHSDNMVTGGLK